jgi:predicted Zn-dependent protease
VAAIEFEGRVQASSCDLQVAVALAQSLWWSGQPMAAVQQYGWVADQLCARGQHDVALSTFRMMASLSPYCVATQLRCAEQYARCGATTEAISIWDWAGAELAAQGRTLEAADVITRAVQLRPDDADRRWRLGDMYATLGMIDAAVEQLHAAGQLKLAQRRFGDFVATAERLLSARRGHVPTLRALACVHLESGDLRATFDALRQLLRVSRGDAVAGELMVEILVRVRRHRAARTAAELVAKILLAQDNAHAHAVARRVVTRAQSRYPADATFLELDLELEAEPLEEDAIEVLEEVAATTSPRSGWEETGLFKLVEHAMSPDVAPEDLETNVFAMANFRPRTPDRTLERTRPDARGAVIVGTFGAVG